MVNSITADQIKQVTTTIHTCHFCFNQAMEPMRRRRSTKKEKKVSKAVSVSAILERKYLPSGQPGSAQKRVGTQIPKPTTTNTEEKTGERSFLQGLLFLQITAKKKPLDLDDMW